MRWFLVVILAVASLWDGFTTIYGTLFILGTGPLQIVASVLFSALILAFVLNTTRLMKLRRGFLSTITKLFWFIALCYDLYTSWIGNINLIGQGRSDGATVTILIGLTLLVSASPILLSAAWSGKSSDLNGKKATSRATS